MHCPDHEDTAQNRKQESGEEAPRGASSCGSCGDTECSASRRPGGEREQESEDRQRLRSRLARVRHTVIVLSGKGGVGKSTVAVNLAVSLMLSGKRVGLLDVDIHGPSIPTMLGCESATVFGHEQELLPVDVGGLKVLSLGFFLQGEDDAVIWRGPMKMGVIKQFLTDVAWGDLDFLIIDSPPGTGDEPLSVVQLIEHLDGAVIVTTPQKVAAVDVRRSISFCRQLRVPVLGVVENMSGFACPRCGEATPILRSGGGRRMAEDMQVPFLGSLPIDPQIAEACDNGQAFVRQYAASPTAAILREIIKPIAMLDSGTGGDANTARASRTEGRNMKIVIPLAEGKLTNHFGHCKRFAMVDVDRETKVVLGREDIDAPPHEPGLLPSWLAERGVTVVITGGMGQRALGLFAQRGIHVVTGAPADVPERLVAEYLAGTLEKGANACDH
jgi:Mrp family chromosome partitioning ATPase/predicted Fe-Mo cluster-binding NifX family protein